MNIYEIDEANEKLYKEIEGTKNKVDILELKILIKILKTLIFSTAE